MSKPTTMAERAAAYLGIAEKCSPGVAEKQWPTTVATMAAFAAREVARVNKLQRGPLRYMNTRYLCVPDAQKALRQMKAATRPERATRAKAKLPPGNWTPALIAAFNGLTPGAAAADVNHKPVKREPSRCVLCGFPRSLHYGDERRCGIVDTGRRFKPIKKSALSALARATKKGTR